MLHNQLVLSEVLSESLEISSRHLDKLMTTAFTRVNKLTESVAEAEERIQNIQSGTAGNRWVALGLFLHGALLLYGQSEVWKPVFGLAAVGVGALMLWGPEVVWTWESVMPAGVGQWMSSSVKEEASSELSSLGVYPHAFHTALLEKGSLVTSVILLPMILFGGVVGVAVHLWHQRRAARAVEGVSEKLDI